ncbi:MAG: pyruvate formate lyase family protein [Planctomycetaceae bacterium]|nr:hypothetical protein [Planctomycetaceae bacterium]
MISTTVRRLSDSTRELARRALSGEWGRSLFSQCPTFDGRSDLAAASDEIKFAHSVKMIAEQAPLRIVPGEKVVGSATLQAATCHQLPVLVDGKAAFGSTSHTTLGFERLLQVGYDGLRRQIAQRLARGDVDDKGRDFLAALNVCLDAAAIWHRRYMDLLNERIAGSSGAQRETYQQTADALAAVAGSPPANFRQAVQVLWLAFAFQRLCGNWPGIGRIDKMLGPFLSRDLAAGRMTLDEARELLAHFWIKGCDWVGAHAGPGSGDAQYYQNIVLGGVDEAGREILNDVTYLVLDVVEELGINEFPIAVRVRTGSPEPLLRRIAQVQRLGGGIVAVYNDAQIIQSLVDFGYRPEEARDFANDGCWEILVPGKTNFGYCPFDVLSILQQTLGVKGDGRAASYASFEALYAAFRARLAAQVDEIQRQIDGAKNGYPSPLASLLVEDCIERARGYNDGGPQYTVRAPHAGGLADAGNSLLAIRRLVYDERRIPLGELVRILRQDWSGHEDLRQYALHRVGAYGNADGAADALTKRVFDDFLAAVAAVQERNGIVRPPGVSTFGREIEWRHQRGAIAAGRKDGDILALNFSPSPGTDLKGPTAVIESHCSMDLRRLTNGTALELKMDPTAVSGDKGVETLAALVQTFLRLGGIFLHIDVVDDRVLRDAQAHPEMYQGLAVRVSGWSARFVTLNRDWQEMIIARTIQK